VQRRSLAVVVGLADATFVHHQPGSYDPNGLWELVLETTPAMAGGSDSRPNISVSVLKALLLGETRERGEEKGVERRREGYYVRAEYPTHLPAMTTGV